MSIGQPCLLCNKGHIRPFHFSRDQAVGLCNNIECDSILEKCPWECGVDLRDIRQQPSHQLKYGSHQDWNRSTSTSDTQSDTSSQISHTHFIRPSIEKRSDLDIKNFSASFRASSVKELSKALPHQAEVAITQSVSDPNSFKEHKCKSFFDLLSELDLEFAPVPVNSEVQFGSSCCKVDTDIGTDELESWIKDLQVQTYEADSRPNTHVLNSEMNVSSRECSSQVDSTASLDNSPSQPFLSGRSVPLLPKGNNAVHSQGGDNPGRNAGNNLKLDTGNMVELESLLQNRKFKSSVVKENCSREDLPLCYSQYSPAPSAASDSGFSEEGKVPAVSLTSLQRVCRKSSISSTVSAIELDEASSQTSIQSLLDGNTKSCIPSNTLHYNVHPTFITVDKLSSVGESTNTSERSMEPREVITPPVNESTCTEELHETKGNEDTHNLDLEKKLAENPPESSRTSTVNRDLSHVNVPLESNPASLESIVNEIAVSSLFQSDRASDSVEFKVSESQTNISPLSLSECPIKSIDQSKKSKILSYRHRRKKRISTQRRFKNQKDLSECVGHEVNQEHRRSRVGKGKGRGRGRGRGGGRQRQHCNVNNIVEALKRDSRRLVQRPTRQRCGSIEVQAPSKGQLCDVAVSDNSEPRNSFHSFNLTNLSLRSLLSGTFNKDPWSVPEMYLEELDIEVVVQGRHTTARDGKSPSTAEERKSSAAEETKSPAAEETKSLSTAERKSLSTAEERKSPNTVEERKSPAAEDGKSPSTAEERKSPSTAEERKSPAAEDGKSPSAAEDGKSPSAAEDGKSPAAEEGKSPAAEERMSPSAAEERKSPVAEPAEEGKSPTAEEGESPTAEEEISPAAEDENSPPVAEKGISLAGKKKKSHLTKDERKVFACNMSLEENCKNGKMSDESSRSREDQECKQMNTDVPDLHTAELANGRSTITLETYGSKTESTILPTHLAHTTAVNTGTSESVVDSSYDCNEYEILSCLSDGIPVSYYEIVPDHVSYSQGHSQTGYVKPGPEGYSSSPGIILQHNKQQGNHQSNWNPEHSVEDTGVFASKSAHSFSTCLRMQEGLQLPFQKEESKILNELNSPSEKKLNDREKHETKEPYAIPKDFMHKNLLVESSINADQHQVIENIHELDLGTLGINFRELCFDESDQNREPVKDKAYSVIHTSAENITTITRAGFQQQLLPKSFIKENSMSNEEKNTVLVPEKYLNYFNESISNKIAGCEHILKTDGRAVGDSSSAQSQILEESKEQGEIVSSRVISPVVNTHYRYPFLSPSDENVRGWMGCQEDATKIGSDSTCPKKSNENEKICVKEIQKANEVDTETLSSNYFGSILQDIDFDESFFQCPVKEQPEATFHEHIGSSLFFGETASNSQFSNTELNNDSENTEINSLHSNPERGFEMENCLFDDKISQQVDSEITSQSVGRSSTPVNESEKLPSRPLHNATIVPTHTSYFEPSCNSSSLSYLPILKPQELVKESLSAASTNAPIPTVKQMVPIKTQYTLGSAVSHAKFSTTLSLYDDIAKTLETAKNDMMSNNYKRKNDSMRMEFAKRVRRDEGSSNDATGCFIEKTTEAYCEEGIFLNETNVNMKETNSEVPEEIASASSLGTCKDSTCCSVVPKKTNEAVEIQDSHNVNHVLSSVTNPSDDYELPVISLDSEDEVQITIPKKLEYHTLPQNDKCCENTSGEGTNKVAVLKENNIIDYSDIGHVNILKTTSSSTTKPFKLDMEKCNQFSSNDPGQGQPFFIAQSTSAENTLKGSDTVDYEKGDSHTQGDSFTSGDYPLMCGILDDSVVHDEHCLSSHQYEFQGNSVGKTDMNLSDKINVYFGSRKEKYKRVLEDCVTKGLDLCAAEHTINCNQSHVDAVHKHKHQNSTENEFDFSYKFGCTKSSPQFDNFSSSDTEEQDPGWLEINSSFTEFLSSLVSADDCKSCDSEDEGQVDSSKIFKSSVAKDLTEKESCKGAKLTQGTEKPFTKSKERSLQCEENLQVPLFIHENTKLPSNRGVQFIRSEGKVFKPPVLDSESVNCIQYSDTAPTKLSVESVDSSLTSCTIKKATTANEVIGHTSPFKPPVLDSESVNCIQYSDTAPVNLSVQSVDSSLTSCTIKKATTANEVIGHISPFHPSNVSFVPSKSNVTSMTLTRTCSSPCFSDITKISNQAGLTNMGNSGKANEVFQQSGVPSFQGSFTSDQNPSSLLLHNIGPVLSGDTQTSLWSSSHNPSSEIRFSSSSSHPYVIVDNDIKVKRQEAVIDCKMPTSAKSITIIPPALTTSYVNANFTQLNPLLEVGGNIPTTSLGNPRKRIMIIANQNVNEQRYQWMRNVPHVSQSMKHTEERMTTNRMKGNMCTAELYSSDKVSNEQDTSGSMLKKVKMGSRGSFYLRPTPALKNAISQMRKNLTEQKNENKNKDSEFLLLPDGDPISHPIFVTSKIVDKSKRKENSKTRKSSMAKRKVTRQMEAFVREKVEESLIRCQENDDIPAVVMVCVAGKLHLYQRDPS